MDLEVLAKKLENVETPTESDFTPEEWSTIMKMVLPKKKSGKIKAKNTDKKRKKARKQQKASRQKNR